MKHSKELKEAVSKKMTKADRKAYFSQFRAGSSAKLGTITMESDRDDARSGKRFRREMNQIKQSYCGTAL